MKISRKEEPVEFKPVTVEVTFETEEELDEFLDAHERFARTSVHPHIYTIINKMVSRIIE